MLADEPTGVVLADGALHVRGGRAGEVETWWSGLLLRDPLTHRALRLPVLAIERATLETGAIDAGRGGAMAGVRLRLAERKPRLGLGALVSGRPAIAVREARDDRRRPAG